MSTRTTLAIAAASVFVLTLYTWEFWAFLAAAVVQLLVGGGVEGFPSPSVFP